MVERPIEWCDPCPGHAELAGEPYIEAEVEAEFFAERREVLARALANVYEHQHGPQGAWVVHVGPPASLDGRRSMVLTGPGVFDE